ncbi:MAG: hypothetical protein JWN61_2464 [Pseudonocardiales bacterium]|nr:hypothetical protein [Pseudonocardiales bacterium]
MGRERLVVEMLILDLKVKPKNAHWRETLEETRGPWIDTQLRTMMRERQEVAVEALRELGYSVEPAPSSYRLRSTPHPEDGPWLPAWLPTESRLVPRLAEDGGFEPPRVLSQHDFQSCALGQLGESSAEESTASAAA